jgi:uncharacterized protein (DUF1697 family)
MTSAVALLRGINVGGHRRVPMAELRELAGSIGLESPRTYVASGNLLFRTNRSREDAAAELERAIERRFGFFVDVLVRTREDWQAYRETNPFRAAADEQSKWVWMFLSKEPPSAAAAAELAVAASGIRVERAGDAIWTHFPEGVSTKILAIKWDKVIGSPSTSRNWRTVETIGRMLDELQIG